MKRLCAVVAVSFTAVVALSGCSLPGAGTKDKAASAAGVPTDAATTSAAEPTAEATAKSGLGSVKDEGDIPDPCTVLSKTEVTDLTGRAITQTDEDGAQPGDTTRFCQWQQDSGQLALFLSRTTEDDFKTAIDGATPVDGVGEDAFQLAGHLYVLYGTVQIDVYSRGGSDDKNLSDEIDVAKLVIPRI
jgi:hypothetical protein